MFSDMTMIENNKLLERRNQARNVVLLLKKVCGMTGSAGCRVGGFHRGASRMPFYFSNGMGHAFSRIMSTAVGESSDKIGYVSNVAEILTDKTAEVVTSQAPPVNEVAIAAADSFFPVAALQYLMDGVHSMTGLPWKLDPARSPGPSRSAISVP